MSIADVSPRIIFEWLADLDVPWHMIGGFTLPLVVGGLTLTITGCPPPPQDPPQPPPVNMAVEQVNTPEMIADLHRRERDYFAAQTEQAKLAPPPAPKFVRFFNVEWEPMRSPDTRTMHRTPIPDGWLVIHGGIATIVSDINHAWTADFQTKGCENDKVSDR